MSVHVVCLGSGGRGSGGVVGKGMMENDLGEFGPKHFPVCKKSKLSPEFMDIS